MSAQDLVPLSMQQCHSLTSSILGLLCHSQAIFYSRQSLLWFVHCICLQITNCPILFMFLSFNPLTTWPVSFQELTPFCVVVGPLVPWGGLDKSGWTWRQITISGQIRLCWRNLSCNKLLLILMFREAGDWFNICGCFHVLRLGSSCCCRRKFIIYAQG